MSVGDVKSAFKQVIADRKIDVKDVDTILKSAGAISVEEEKAIKQQADEFKGMMDPAASRKLKEKLGEVAYLRKEATNINKKVSIAQKKLSTEAAGLLKAGAPTKSFGGTAIPEDVKKAVNTMMAGGAIAYDVREMKTDPVYDTEHGDPELMLDGKFNPYGQDQKAADSMAFSHTELTPAKIEQDMNTVQSFNVCTGVQNDQAQFQKVSMKGNGRITELYDEASWSDTFGRGPGGQKYASNFAILADGSVHCVPASRRTKADPGRILTTASLGEASRCSSTGTFTWKTEW